jgi:serine/threonine protein kinase
MEFVDGVNLAQLMKSGRISPREALAIVPQICGALQFAHDQGIVHRDIKPENILLDRLGRVKVADFGIAKLSSFVVPPSGGSEDKDHLKVGLQTDPLLTEAGKVMGTPQYMAPEQSDYPADVDHRADIFALGVVFYQMLTGELPGKEMQAPSRKVSIDVRLDEIVMQAMKRNPARRYQTALDLRTVVDGLEPTAAQMPHPPPLKRGMLKRWWWVFLIMLPLGLLIGLAAGSVWIYIVPKKYVAEAVIKVRPSSNDVITSSFFGTQFESIKSQESLSAVSDQLKLPDKWMVRQDVVIRILKGIIDTQNIRGTDLISIRVRHTNKDDVVDISNALIFAYQKKFAGEVIVHDSATPPMAPVSPNVLLILVIGGFGGLILSPLMALMLILILQRVFPDKKSAH